MYRMRYLAESRAFSHDFFTFICIYIYIYKHLCLESHQNHFCQEEWDCNLEVVA